MSPPWPTFFPRRVTPSSLHTSTRQELGFGKGGYFPVPRVVLEMKKNIDPKTIESIVFHKPENSLQVTDLSSSSIKPHIFG
jgi:hypothetical protein